MTDQKQEARTLTLGERIVLVARLAVEEHIHQSVTEVPLGDSYFGLTDYREEFLDQLQEQLSLQPLAHSFVRAA